MTTLATLEEARLLTTTVVPGAPSEETASGIGLAGARIWPVHVIHAVLVPLQEQRAWDVAVTVSSKNAETSSHDGTISAMPPGDLVSYVRLWLSLSVDTLAAACGVARAAPYSWQHGTTPRPDALDRLLLLGDLAQQWETKIGEPMPRGRFGLIRTRGSKPIVHAIAAGEPRDSVASLFAEYMESYKAYTASRKQQGQRTKSTASGVDDSAALASRRQWAADELRVIRSGL